MILGGVIKKMLIYYNFLFENEGCVCDFVDFLDVVSVNIFVVVSILSSFIFALAVLFCPHAHAPHMLVWTG